jgi:hypothetical protein
VLAAAAVGGLGWWLARSDAPADDSDAGAIDAALTGQVFRATAHIAPGGGGSGGWGVLIDRGERLVATLPGFVGDREATEVSFADPDGRDTYETTGRTVSRNAQRGLVLLRLDQLPGWAVAPPQGAGPLPKEQPLVSFCAAEPGATGTWEFHQGKVRHVLQPPHY